MAIERVVAAFRRWDARPADSDNVNRLINELDNSGVGLEERTRFYDEVAAQRRAAWRDGTEPDVENIVRCVATSFGVGE